MGVTVMVDYATYAVVGTTWTQIERAVALLGPTRDGVTYPAYTDWRIEWGFGLVSMDAAWHIAGLRVDALVTVTLPTWLGLPAAAVVLKRRWNAYVDNLSEHEAGHVDVARRAAHDAYADMSRVAPSTNRRAFVSALSRAGEGALSAARSHDVSYDARCRARCAEST